MQTIIALILLIGGVVLIVVGFQQSRGVTDQAAKVVLGRFTQQTMLFLIGGAIAALVGVALLV
ncbi:MAG: DUF3185 family protein [Thioalkalivibrionaceae bacterium]